MIISKTFKKLKNEFENKIYKLIKKIDEHETYQNL